MRPKDQLSDQAGLGPFSGRNLGPSSERINIAHPNLGEDLQGTFNEDGSEDH